MTSLEQALASILELIEKARAAGNALLLDYAHAAQACDLRRAGSAGAALNRAQAPAARLLLRKTAGKRSRDRFP